MLTLCMLDDFASVDFFNQLFKKIFHENQKTKHCLTVRIQTRLNIFSVICLKSLSADDKSPLTVVTG